MKDWLMELCPELADWQAEIIAEHVAKAVSAEREACAKVCDRFVGLTHQHEEQIGPGSCAAAIRARGEG